MAVKFGVQFKPEFKDFKGVVDAFQAAQELGFSSGWLYDHLYSIGGKPPLEAWTTLAALAAVVDHIRLGVLVSCNSFRYPQVLAKMASTVDIISRGRLEFGIGAGWFKKEYIAYGIPFPPLSARLEELEEAVHMIKMMWTQESADFDGKHYSIHDLKLEPKPIQKPHPPIWIGGNPDPLLKLVARYGDAYNLVYVSPKEVEEKNRYLKSECQKIGRNYESIIRSWHGSLFLSENIEALRSDAAKKRASSLNKRIRSLSEEEYLQKVIWGKPDNCIEQIQSFVDSGIDYFILAEPSEVRPELKRFAKEVMPSFI